MLHWWLVPVSVAIGSVLGLFYLVVKHTGGSGERTEGRTLMDKPEIDADPPGKG